MANFNKVFLMGNLTRDPELRYTPAGVAVSNIRIAVNTRFRSRAGEQKLETCFITVVVWDKQAEACNQYLQKGRPVFVEGRLQQRNWQDREGKARSTLEVRADRIQFLGGAKAAQDIEGAQEITRAGEDLEEQEEGLDADRLERQEAEEV